MTPQSNFMILATITNGQLAPLKTLLSSMNQAPGFADPRNSLLPYWQFQRLHVARFTVLEANTNDDIRGHGKDPTYWPPALCFLGDIDGDSDMFLAELVIRAEPGLRHIFSHCDGFCSEHSDLLSWMQEHSHSPQANYINTVGRTVIQIREEATLQQALAKEVRKNQSAYDPARPTETRRALKRFVQGEVDEKRLKLTPDTPTPTPWFIANALHLIAMPLALACLFPLFLLASPLYFYQLRKLERSDPQNTARTQLPQLQGLAEQEDIDVSNHFNVFGQVKPGRLRLFTIRMGLLLLNYASRHIYTRGYLTRIQTIHFARWVLLDNNRRVFFASNYDGSADSYMDDFINKVAWGLNLVFSNGVGYPRTRWLLKGGAEDEEKYKRTLRRNQLPSQSWYKAYPGLSAFDMARNSRIRQGLVRHNASVAQIREWLSLL
jgi:hypothetical protein